MKILITGTSNGIGRAAALKFIENGHFVVGFDKLDSTIDSKNYFHYKLDIKNKDDLPDLEDIEIIFNNAGTQNSGEDLQNNLIGAMNVTEKYGFKKSVKSILFNASASAHTGFEFSEYSASKAGLIGYMKNVAWRCAKFGATVNSISLGGVLTESNNSVIQDKESWEKIMNVTPLKKWATLEEVSEWVYFLTIINKSCSGEDFLIDNGETKLNCSFIWPNFN